MKNLGKLGLAVVTATALNATEPKVSLAETQDSISAQVKGDVLELGLNEGPLYVNVSSNFDDEKGAGVAYSNSGVTVGASYVTKDNVGRQKGIGVGYVKELGNDDGYIGGAAKYTEFDAASGYANSQSTNAKVFVGKKINENFTAEIGAEGQRTTYNGYDNSDKDYNLNGGFTYTPNSRNYSIEVRGTTNNFQNKVSATIVIPIGKVPKSTLPVGQHTVEKYVADSTWNNSMVKVAKAPVIETPENTNPVAIAGSTDGGFNASKTFSMAGEVSDAEDPDSALTIVVTKVPAYTDDSKNTGSITVNGTDVTFNMNLGEGGNSYFLFKVRDSEGALSEEKRYNLNNFLGLCKNLCK